MNSTKKSKFFVCRERRQGMCLPTMKSWDSCYSLIYSESGNIDAVDAEWVGFFVNEEIAEKVKSILEKNDTN